MNRYPLWKYLLVLAVIVVGLVYALPNLYGEYPAVQISPTRTTKVDAAVLARAEGALKRVELTFAATQLDEAGARIRFADTETQIRALDVLQKELGDSYTVALNLLPETPGVLQTLGGKPMYLGLDLRGGVHFLMQVDMRAVLKKAGESYAEDLRRIMRESKARYLTVRRLEGGSVEARFRDAAERDKARVVIQKEMRELQLTDAERRFLDNITREDPAIIELAIFDADGDEVYKVEKATISIVPSSEDITSAQYFIDAVHNGREKISEPKTSVYATSPSM